MPRYLLVALNGPTDGEGDEAIYNQWYDEVHATDLLKVAGAKSVRRFKVRFQNRIDKPYLNITEIEADTLEDVLRELGEHAANFIPQIDRSTSISLIGEEITRH